MVTSVDTEGSPAANLFAHLMEDVTNLRGAISVSRITVETSCTGMAEISCRCSVSNTELRHPPGDLDRMSTRDVRETGCYRNGNTIWRAPWRYAAEAGNVFNEDLMILVFLEGLQPFAAHSIRSRVPDDMAFAQVQKEAEDAGLAGRAVDASTRSLALPRTTPIRSPFAPRPRATVAMAVSDASSDPPVFDDYQTPTTHRVVATVDYATRDSLQGDMWEGESDISVPTRHWTSCAGSAQDNQVLAVGDNRNCYLCFGPDNFIVNCPNLTAEQLAPILRKRAAQSQNGGLAYGPKLVDRPMGNIQKPYVAKPMGQYNGYQERAYGKN
jgi:hypothetical protein